MIAMRLANSTYSWNAMAEVPSKPCLIPASFLTFASTAMQIFLASGKSPVCRFFIALAQSRTISLLNTRMLSWRFSISSSFLAIDPMVLCKFFKMFFTFANRTRRLYIFRRFV